ncbi:hypothetical protein ACJ51O_09620 [Burkholderia pyrrocinia]|uniref:hypothetical protein n=1 Tax=Burkholderia pyrrocinia TaxID=60550 RepID=UPI001FB44D6F|nr:hypothetical protein [Burkholderia pyrrocinia]UOB54113.1 hypothetical protein MRS60_09355 [Burkholderia pyrrocinia]
MAVNMFYRLAPTPAQRLGRAENPNQIKSLAYRPAPLCRLACFLSQRSRLQMQNPIEDTP